METERGEEEDRRERGRENNLGHLKIGGRASTRRKGNSTLFSYLHSLAESTENNEKFETHL